MEIILLFTGLIGFVPQQALAPGPVNQMQATFVNATQTCPPHVATILVDRSFVDFNETTREYVEVEENPGFVRFDLSGERVELLPRPDECPESGGCLTVVRGLVKEPDRLCPTPENRRDIFWMGAMDRIHPGKGRMRRDCQHRPGTVPQYVRAHFVLDHGELSVADFGRFPDDHVIRWEIDRPGEDFEQALADLIELRATLINATSATLQFWNHADGTWEEDAGKIVLKPPVTGSSTPVVEIKNTPEDDLCRQEVGNDDPRAPDFHYQHLYRLLQQRDPVEELEPESRCPKLKTAPYTLCSPGSVRLNDPQCPVGLFEGS